MVSVFIYFVVTVVVAAVIFIAAVFVFGRGESLPPIASGETLTTLPRKNVVGDDARNLVFGVRFRGYDMTEVDWAISQLAAEIDSLRSRLNAETEARHPERLGESSGALPKSAKMQQNPQRNLAENDPALRERSAGESENGQWQR